MKISITMLICLRINSYFHIKKTQNDGLSVANERSDVIGAWACLHVPDIFVEVDWMAGHEMSDEAVGKVMWSFARHGIALHIDRGEMGGGGEVPLRDEITWDDDENRTDMDDIWDYRTRYFLPAHERVFHYCLMAHLEINDPLFSDILGKGIVDYDMFVVYKENIGSDTTKEASVFMHELGHNIHVYDNDDDESNGGDGDGILDRYGWYTGWQEDDENEDGADVPDDGDNRDEDDDDDHTFEDYCELSCAMKEGGETVDYCSHHWNQINLAATF